MSWGVTRVTGLPLDKRYTIGYTGSVVKGATQKEKGQLMNNTKTRWVITWEDGRTEVIYRKSNGWHWSGGRGYAGGISSHLDNVKHQVKALGGTMVREPNPDYRETEPEPFALLGRVLRGF